MFDRGRSGARPRRAAQRVDAALRLTRPMRLGEYSVSWLPGKRKQIKTATLDRYARTLAPHIVPKLGDYYADAISHHDIVKWLNEQDAQASTINSRLRVLKTMMVDATVAFALPRAPALRVKTLSETGGASFSEEEPEVDPLWSGHSSQFALMFQEFECDGDRREYLLA